MDYNFQKFTAVSSRNEDRITITKSYTFGFPTKVFRDNNLGDYKYVVLYYDGEQRVIGFRFINDEAEPAKFAVIKSKQGYGGNVIATSFFKRNSLKPDTVKGKYDWTMEEVEGIGKLFVIKLKFQQESPAPEVAA